MKENQYIFRLGGFFAFAVSSRLRMGGFFLRYTRRRMGKRRRNFFGSERPLAGIFGFVPTAAKNIFAAGDFFAGELKKTSMAAGVFGKGSKKRRGFFPFHVFHILSTSRSNVEEFSTFVDFLGSF